MREQLLTVLKNISIFKDIEFSVLNPEKGFGKLAAFREGEILYKNGDNALAGFILLKGNVQIIRKAASGNESIQVLLNDHFGFEDCLMGTERNETAIAAGDTYAIEFELDDINTILSHDLNFYQKFVPSESDTVDNPIEQVLPEIPDNLSGDSEPGESESVMPSRGNEKPPDIPELIETDSVAELNSESEPADKEEDFLDSLLKNNSESEETEIVGKEISEVQKPDLDEVTSHSKKEINRIDISVSPSHEISASIQSVPAEKQSAEVFSREQLTKYLIKIFNQKDEISLFREIENITSAATDSEYSKLFIFDPVRSTLFTKIETAGEITDFELPLGQGVAGWSARKKEPVFINPGDSPEFVKKDDTLDPVKFQNMVSAPYFDSNGNVKLVIQAFNKKSGRFSSDDVKILEYLSGFIISAFESARTNDALLAGERRSNVTKLSRLLDVYVKKQVLISQRYAENILEREKFLPDEVKKSIKGIIEMTNEVHSNIQKLRDFSFDKLNLRQSDKNLNSIVREYIEKNELHLMAKKYSLMANYSKEDPLIRADVSKMFDVLDLLINNAMEAMPSGGLIKLMTYSFGRTCEIVVADEGQCIPEIYRERIFEPFFSYNKENHPGLGLAIAKNIINAHGGDINYRNTDTKGSKITITLPVFI